jgi:hypothetical protein
MLNFNDRAVAYMPMPVRFGTNSNPNWSSVDGYDATNGAFTIDLFKS